MEQKKKTNFDRFILIIIIIVLIIINFVQSAQIGQLQRDAEFQQEINIELNERITEIETGN